MAKRLLYVRYPQGHSRNNVPSAHLHEPDGPPCGAVGVQEGRNRWEVVEAAQVPNWGLRLCKWCRMALDEELSEAGRLGRLREQYEAPSLGGGR